jgi:DNA-binding GntR family transcriptional regulator
MVVPTANESYRRPNHVDFAHCQLCDEHARLLAMMERGQWKNCLKLMDEHYRLIARGYRIEEISPVEEPLFMAFGPGKVATGGSA